MNLDPGTRLGPYEITASLGAGGMGEVYRARDTRLDRTVAVKVLPARLSANATLRERFAREAKTISSLTHPHICSLFDVGQTEGIDYLVMEHIEGESLAQRLAKGAIPIEQAVRYGIQIAEALQAAHKHGIVHRDLKPGNVMLTRNGAKLLDFGLAKWSETAAQSDGTTLVGVGATEKRGLTEEGTIVGTFQYMAPEQIEGSEADARSDIFAFGATLYEMVTGKRAFDGKSRASIIASILDRDPPPISTIQPTSPPALDRIIKICLAKDPDERWQSAHDVAAELKWVAESSAQMAVQGRRGLSRKLQWGIGGALLGVVAGAGAMWLLAPRASAPAQVVRFTMTLPPQKAISIGSNRVVALSRDGQRIVYRGKDAAGRAMLYLRNLSQADAVPIAGSEEAYGPIFSPNGHAILFATNTGHLRIVQLDGGSTTDLARNTNGIVGVDWHDDTIYYNHSFTKGLWSVPAAGGEPKLIADKSLTAGVRAMVWPQMLPDGKHLLYTGWTGKGWDESKVIVRSLADGSEFVLADGSEGRYVPTGHLLFLHGTTLFAAPFDAKAIRLAAAPQPVVNNVASGSLNGEAHYDVSDNGSLIYIAGGVLAPLRSLVWVDRRGNEQPAVPTARPYSNPAISPDGRTIAVTLETSTFDVWQLDLERDTMTRVSFGGDDSGPVWTPDGRRILWTSTRNGGHNNIYWSAADNSETETRLSTTNEDDRVNHVSPDGSTVIATRVTPKGIDIVALPLGGDKTVKPVVASPFNEGGGNLSPDGRWMIYGSNESGRNEIYVRPYPGSGGRWQVSTDGALGWVWARSGREILYRNDNRFYAVPFETQPQVHIGKPQFLFEKPLERSGWDVSLDDQRILALRSAAVQEVNELAVVLNWFEELKRRVPVK